MKEPWTAILLRLYYLCYSCYAQDQPDKVTGTINFSSKLFSQRQIQTVSLNMQFSRQSLFAGSVGHNTSCPSYH